MKGKSWGGLLDYLPGPCCESYTETYTDNDTLVHNVAIRNRLDYRRSINYYCLSRAETWTYVLYVKLGMYMVCSGLQCSHSNRVWYSCAWINVKYVARWIPC